MKHYRLIFLLISLLWLLTACDSAATPTPTSAVAQATATTVATSTTAAGTAPTLALATATHTPAPTATPSATATTVRTSTPTRTPRPTNTPTATPTITATPIVIPIPGRYDLPAWLADDDADIFMTITAADHPVYQLTFFRPDLNLRFDLPITNVRGYFWLPDGRAFGFLPEDSQFIAVVNLADGQVTRYPTDEAMLLFIFTTFEGPVPNPYLVTRNRPDEVGFVLLGRYHGYRQSPDGRYLARLIFGEGVEIIELDSGDSWLIADEDDSHASWQMTWSPVGDPLVAVLQGPAGEPSWIFPGDRIVVYDIVSGSQAAVYEGTFEYFSWSPDGRFILYQATYEEQTPCLFDVQTTARRCFPVIEAQFPGAQISSVYWQRDGRAFSFHLWYPPLPRAGEFCTLALDDEAITCQAIGWPVTGDQMIISRQWAPSGRYSAIEYDTSCPGCDYVDAPSSALLSADGSAYIDLGPELYAEQRGEKVNGSFIVSSLHYPYDAGMWRPLPPGV